jgi:hypothetical protein
MNKKLLLVVGLVLLGIGIFKPNLTLPVNKPVDHHIVIVTPPSDDNLKKLCGPVIEALKNGSSSRNSDGKRLSELYFDLATLVELDGENEVVKTTEEIRQANSLSGVMLRMDLKGKYPDLAKSAQEVLNKTIGDDIIPLDKALRAKAVETFKALSWATNEGSK